MDCLKENFNILRGDNLQDPRNNLAKKTQDDDIFEGTREIGCINSIDENYGNKPQMSSPKVKYGKYSDMSGYSRIDKKVL